MSGSKHEEMEGFKKIMSDLRKGYKISVIISGAMIASLFIYVLVVEFIKARHEPFLGFVRLQDKVLLRYVFYGLSVVIVLILRMFRGILLRKSPTDDALTLINKLQRTSILTSALCEGPSLFGLILFLLGGFSRDFYLLSFVSLVLLFMYFPRYKNWQGWLNINRNNSSCFL